MPAKKCFEKKCISFVRLQVSVILVVSVWLILDCAQAQLVGGGGGEAAALTGAYLAQLAQNSSRTLCERITNTRPAPKIFNFCPWNEKRAILILLEQFDKNQNFWHLNPEIASSVAPSFTEMRRMPLWQNTRINRRLRRITETSRN